MKDLCVTYILILLYLSMSDVNKRKSEPSNDVDSKRQKLEDPKFILPKQVNTNPATLPERKKNIELIVGILLKKTPGLQTPKLRAIEIEYEIAKNHLIQLTKIKLDKVFIDYNILQRLNLQDHPKKN